MRGAALALLVAAAALAVCAAAVFGLGDRRTMVAPPEAVAEDFVRTVWKERYPQAAPSLAAEARERVGEDALRDARARLEAAAGGIEDVSGAPGWIEGDAAEALAEVRGRGRTVVVRLPLRREMGEWRVAGLGSLAP